MPSQSTDLVFGLRMLDAVKVVVRPGDIPTLNQIGELLALKNDFSGKTSISIVLERMDSFEREDSISKVIGTTVAVDTLCYKNSRFIGQFCERPNVRKVSFQNMAFKIRKPNHVDTFHWKYFEYDNCYLEKGSLGWRELHPLCLGFSCRNSPEVLAMVDFTGFSRLEELFLVGHTDF